MTARASVHEGQRTHLQQHVVPVERVPLFDDAIVVDEGLPPLHIALTGGEVEHVITREALLDERSRACPTSEGRPVSAIRLISGGQMTQSRRSRSNGPPPVPIGCHGR